MMNFRHSRYRRLRATSRTNIILDGALVGAFVLCVISQPTSLIYILALIFCSGILIRNLILRRKELPWIRAAHQFRQSVHNLQKGKTYLNRDEHLIVYYYHSRKSNEILVVDEDQLHDGGEIDDPILLSGTYFYLMPFGNDLILTGHFGGIYDVNDEGTLILREQPKTPLYRRIRNGSLGLRTGTAIHETDQLLKLCATIDDAELIDDVDEDT